VQNNTAPLFRPVAPPRIFENAYTPDQHRRMLETVRRNGPWKLIVAHHFKSPEEILASVSGSFPKGAKPTWDMFLTPVFRGWFARASTSLYPELEDCFFNHAFLDMVRGYWNAAYARPDNMLFNLQGACPGSRTPHIDGTRFRGITLQNTPVWLMNIMVKSGLFRRWQVKKAQIIAWYYKGKIGGGFSYWPDGQHGQPQQIKAPMWGRAVVVENEMMYHTAEATGPAHLRRPQGLAFNSVIGADPDTPDGWQITTDGEVIQRIAADELRFLIHWGADIFMDYDELKVNLDHSDDIGHDQIFDILIKDLRSRGERVETPSDPMTDASFIHHLTRVYDPGIPTHFPPEPTE